MIVGAGVVRHCQYSGPSALGQLQSFLNEKKSWRFGHLCYELPTQEKVAHTPKEDFLQFPDLAFFEPEIVLQFSAHALTIIAADPDAVYQSILQQNAQLQPSTTASIKINQRISKTEYLNIVRQLKEHIQRGDCYEINFCQEFYSEKVIADPFLLYQKLSQLSPNPFSGLYRLHDKWMICASPERFIRKESKSITSQPIKGTLQRNSKKKMVKQEQLELLNSDKDRSENVMVVDLVRNDLSRICKEGTVNVDELFGIYTFPQVHQMISTISGTLTEPTSFADIIRAMFPMGSMTGAPKMSVMNLIDRYEPSKRGLFSGTIGYITPQDDFDFNVVIRSMLYNQTMQYLSFQTGSGITIYSDPVKEWEECMIKAGAIKKILSG